MTIRSLAFRVWLLTLYAVGAHGSAQLALLDSNVADTYKLEVLSGGLEPGDLLNSRVALIFVTMPDCPACELLLEHATTWNDFGLKVVLVSNSLVATSGPWPTAANEWNIWLDSRDILARLLGVTEAPTVFMVDAGAVVNADYWPFFGGLDGLDSQMAYFSAAPSRRSATAIREGLETIAIDEYSGRRVDGSVVAFSSLALPRLFVLCTPACGVCAEEASFLRSLEAENPALPPTTFVLVSDEVADIQPMAKMIGNDFEIIWLPNDLADALQVEVSPANVFVDADGDVAWSSLGFSESLGNKLLNGEM